MNDSEIMEMFKSGRSILSIAERYKQQHELHWSRQREKDGMKKLSLRDCRKIVEGKLIAEIISNDNK